jgi:hypothetical protein
MLRTQDLSTLNVRFVTKVYSHHWRLYWAQLGRYLPTFQTRRNRSFLKTPHQTVDKVRRPNKREYIA